MKRGRMETQESFATRKPLEFTLIILIIIFILLLPVYFYSKHVRERDTPVEVLVAETYAETNFFFSPESDLSESDKRQMFRMKYEGNFVQWTGRLRACESSGGLFTLSIDQRGEDTSDVLFTTQQNCTNLEVGSQVNYKTRLIDWKIRSFIGKDGEIIE